MYLSIENATRAIKKRTVLDHVSLECEHGNIYGLVGPNGSGKTMLLRAICGFIKLDSGRVNINGKPVVFNQLLPDTFGVIIENPGFNNNRSGWDNLEYLAGLDKGWDPAETIRLLKILDLYKHRDEKVKVYSLGMRQKLAIAQALMEHQHLVLLDEPTNGLDKASVSAFLEEMRYQRSLGTSVLIASHHDDEIKQVADRIYTMENGRVSTEESVHSTP